MSNRTVSVDNDPTLAGFTTWVYGPMGVPPSVLPTDSPYLQLAFDTSMNIVLSSAVSGGGLDLVPSQPTSPSIYAIAVYNLGGHFLVNTAQDQIPPAPPPPANAATFWSDLRKALGLDSSVLGFVQSTSDQGTSTSLMVPKQLQDASLMTLQLLKTPWGSAYSAIAGQWGPSIWGIS
jgi:hypothetical protein